MSVIDHDFGGEPRRKSRKFRKLLGLDTLHESNIRDNPLPYLERAGERIFRLKAALFDADLAASVTAGAETSSRMVTIPQSEYDRLRQCRAIVAEALDRYGRDDEL